MLVGAGGAPLVQGVLVGAGGAPLVQGVSPRALYSHEIVIWNEVIHRVKLVHMDIHIRLEGR